MGMSTWGIIKKSLKNYEHGTHQNDGRNMKKDRLIRAGPVRSDNVLQILDEERTSNVTVDNVVGCVLFGLNIKLN